MNRKYVQKEICENKSDKMQICLSSIGWAVENSFTTIHIQDFQTKVNKSNDCFFLKCKPVLFMILVDMNLKSDNYGSTVSSSNLENINFFFFQTMFISSRQEINFTLNTEFGSRAAAACKPQRNQPFTILKIS